LLLLPSKSLIDAPRRHHTPEHRTLASNHQSSFGEQAQRTKK
jgi:hypothetical protein